MAKITGGAPTGRIVYQFRPKEEFKSFEMGGTVYMKGQIYHVRAGNDALHQLVTTWTEQGKVEVL